MPDSFTESSSQSWFGRIGGAFKGLLFGIILVPVSMILLFWNESRAVTTAKSLKEGISSVVDVPPSAVSPEYDKKLVHLSGEVTTDETLDDPIFHLSAQALRLSRHVEMYQWKEETSSETHKKLGGGEETVTTYRYKKDFADKPIDSSKFKHPEEHGNPTQFPVPQFSVLTKQATLGAFHVPGSIIDKMDGDASLAPTDEALDKLPPGLKTKAKLADDGVYFGSDASAPEVGDVRITFEELKPGTFSILAAQAGDSLVPYQTRAGDEIERVESGDVPAATMFQHAESENTVLTWILRGVGFVLMLIGFICILNPLHVFADVLPFLGGIVEFGTSLVAFLLAIGGSLIIIAIAWLAARPLLGITLLVLAMAAIVHVVRKVHQHRTATPTAATAG